MPGGSVTVDWHLTDASGVQFTSFWIRTVSGVPLSGCGGSGTPLLSGDVVDGFYRASCVIPASAPGGVYSVQVIAENGTGNRRPHA